MLDTTSLARSPNQFQMLDTIVRSPNESLCGRKVQMLTSILIYKDEDFVCLFA